jgi:K+-sensing histidine kinase KdpD
MQMHVIERIPQLEARARVHWQKIVLDSLLAIGGVLVITSIMAILRLYPAIPNISILYLLLILPLAIWRRRSTAILAASLAFLAFNFFLVPPLYTFIMATSEWLALGIFLLTALVTSQLASISRRSAQLAWRRERETRILYEMMHAINSQITLDEQLEVMALSTVRIFSHWGVRECAFLLPDMQKHLVVWADAPIQIEAFTLSPEQLAVAGQVMAEGKRRELPSALVSSGEPARLHLIPLQVSERSLGVLALHVQEGDLWFAHLEQTQDEREHSDDQSAFFWTFLDQVVLTIDRARLRSAITGS